MLPVEKLLLQGTDEFVRFAPPGSCEAAGVADVSDVDGDGPGVADVSDVDGDGPGEVLVFSL